MLPSYSCVGGQGAQEEQLTTRGEVGWVGLANKEKFCTEALKKGKHDALERRGSSAAREPRVRWTLG